MERYRITGMSCAACAARIEKAVSQVENVTSCSVSLLTNSMGVEGGANAKDVIKAVQKAGYGAAMYNSAVPSAHNNGSVEDADILKDEETGRLLKRLCISVVFWLILMYVSMGHMMWGWPLGSFFEDNHVGMGILQLLLTIIIMIINKKFFVSGIKSLIHLAPNMDTLVALGSGSAFIYSTCALFAMSKAVSVGDMEAVMVYMDEFYFESAATILTLITFGKMLESLSKGRTTDAIKSLMRLSPKTARVIRDAKKLQVPIEQVMCMDVFEVLPGDNIPVDGKVLEGESAVDESTLTGESIPVDKAAGSMVYAGTRNQSGYIKCQATRVGEDTTLSQIIKMVSDASATKAPIARIADKVSGIFVPAVIVMALITTAVWLLCGQSVGYALARGISVLVISCPCALGLATPVAIMVGNGMGARCGILFKTAVSLENTGKAQIVVLDKTGTITGGKPEVTDIIPAEGISSEKLLSIAYALESKSEHPLAHAINVKAAKDGIELKEAERFEALPGFGVKASLDGRTLYGASLRFINESDIVNINKDLISNEITSLCDKLSLEGKTPLLFTDDGRLCGIIAVADTIKEESKGAIEELSDMGIRTVMLTGDNERTANAIAAMAGVDEVYAGVLPDGKESVIRSLKEQGKVIMVGDGVNDAPALTSADIGIAIGAGADVAVDAADVVLMKSALGDVPAAIRLSRATLRNIHENLFWAFIYNIIGIPLAAGILIKPFGLQLNPMFAAAAMSLSSFCVVTNALRLNTFKMYKKPNAHKCRNNKTGVNNQIKENKTMEKTLTIEGMMCGHCEMHVKKALEAVEGVTGAIVSYEKKTAVVSLSKDVSDEVLKAAVADAGYTVTGSK